MKYRQTNLFWSEYRYERTKTYIEVFWVLSEPQGRWNQELIYRFKSTQLFPSQHSLLEQN